MAFQVELSRRAASDIEEIFEYIAVESDAPLNAARWRHGLEAQLRRLSHLAGSMPLAEENHYAPCELRQMLFGKFRILYTVQFEVAFVLTIRHGHRLPLSPAELNRIWKQN
ncbi:MAG: type II toxin-antitoxin system RelE/ParE family toxin [Planctomycetaceae bacterium]